MGEKPLTFEHEAMQLRLDRLPRAAGHTPIVPTFARLSRFSAMKRVFG
jgi:hypothetical protein